MENEVTNPDSYPEWIPQEAFEAFIEMRKKMRKPMTAYAVKLAIKTLDRLRQEGHDPQAVLDQSIMNSWQGLFPIKNAPIYGVQPLKFKGVK